jgi:hypothetical protein
MYPTIGYQLSQDHLADLRHQAQRTARARAARRARLHQSRQPGSVLPARVRQGLVAQAHCHHSTAPAGRA